MRKIILIISLSLIGISLFLYVSVLRIENVALHKAIDENNRIILLQCDSNFLLKKIIQLEYELKKLHEQIDKKDSTILLLKKKISSDKSFLQKTVK